MKIKTVVGSIADDFDERVNAAIEEGYMLTRRISDRPGPFIAELVQLDPAPEAPPEPQPVGPFDALRVIRDFCAAHNKCGGCQLDEWCGKHLAGNEGPADWIIPGEEAGR